MSILQKIIVLGILFVLCVPVSAQENSSKIGDWEVYEQDTHLVVKKVDTDVYATENWEIVQKEASLIMVSMQTGHKYEIYNDDKILIFPLEKALISNPVDAKSIGNWKVYEQDGALIVKKIQKDIAKIGNWEVYEKDTKAIVKNITTNRKYSILHNGGVFLIKSGNTTENVNVAKLVHEWKFDEQGDSSEAIDSKGRYNGSLYDAKRIPGFVGSGAIAITGEHDSSVEFDKAVGQFATSDFSVSFWLKTQETLSSFDVLGNRSEGSHGNFFQIRMTGKENKIPGKIIVELDNNGVDYVAIDSREGFSDNQWHHIVVTRKATVVKLFIDSVEEVVAESENITNIITSDPFRIGRSYLYGYVPKFSFDDLKIYHSALSNDEVFLLYNSVSHK